MRWHFGVYVIYNDVWRRPPRMTLFEREKDALKEAKFMVHNCESVTVYSLSNNTTYGGKPIYQSSVKRRLVKCKD